MRALLVCEDIAYTVERENYHQLIGRWRQALIDDEATFSFETRATAHHGVTSVTVAMSSILRVEMQ